VALPMDEQRILEEMERMLAAEDPRLAAKLAAFGQPGVVQVLRTRRARAALSLLMLAVIAAAAAVIYLVSAFRSGSGGPSVPHRHYTSQRASTRPEHRNVPLPVHVECLIRVAPRTCAAWTTTAPGGAHATSATPGITDTQGTGSHQGHGSGHVNRPAHAGKP
jgi:hypothetical protein